MRPKRVIAYIDGFNLYNGLVAADLHHLRWLDLASVCESQLNESQELVATRYFTSRLKKAPEKADRQNTFLNALDGCGTVDIVYGRFLHSKKKCSECGHRWDSRHEKKTDVGIAVSMLDDAFDDLVDVLFLMSGDSDLVPAVQSLRQRFPQKQIVTLFPPERSSKELSRFTDHAIQLDEHLLRHHLLPETVIGEDGQPIKAPLGWLPAIS